MNKINRTEEYRRALISVSSKKNGQAYDQWRRTELDKLVDSIEKEEVSFFDQFEKAKKPKTLTIWDRLKRGK